MYFSISKFSSWYRFPMLEIQIIIRVIIIPIITRIRVIVNISWNFSLNLHFSSWCPHLLLFICVKRQEQFVFCFLLFVLEGSNMRVVSLSIDSSASSSLMYFDFDLFSVKGSILMFPKISNLIALVINLLPSFLWLTLHRWG